jgi:hypothetical protein
VGKRTDSNGLGSLATGAVTALALAVQTGLAAIVGVIIARDLGRTAETDGFFASYGVFIVVVLAATAIRIAVLPALARARADRRLGAEVAAYALTLATLAVPLLVLALAAASPLAWLLTGNGAEQAKETAEATLPWMMLAAVLQLYAGLAASALAALDDYVVAAAGYAVGSILGLVYILARVHPDGIDAVARGMALNGAIAVTVPALALALRARRAEMPAEAVRPGGLSFGSRMRELGAAVALPLALQAIYLICLPLAGREGTGAVTSFGYAYLIASAIVAVTASSLGLVTSVPLTRVGLDPARTARHLVSSSWLALVVVGAAAGIFAIAGSQILHALLGADYGSSVGSELGRLVLLLSLWSVVSIGVSVTFPVVFVAQREGQLPLLALVAVVVQVPLAFAGQVLAGLDGLALSLAVTTGLVLAEMLRHLLALRATARGLLQAAGITACLALVAFAPPRAVFEPAAACATGLVLYGVLLAVVRPRGLRTAWHYLRSLG